MYMGIPPRNLVGDFNMFYCACGARWGCNMLFVGEGIGNNTNYLLFAVKFQAVAEVSVGGWGGWWTLLDIPLFENRSHWFNAGLIGMWLCLKEIGYPISPDYHFFCGKMQYFGIHPILRHIQTSYQFVFWYLYDMQMHTHYFVPCIITL